MENLHLFAFADEADDCFDGQIKALKANGLEGPELRNLDGVSVADLSDQKAHEIHRKLDAQGLRVWSVGSPIGKIDIEKGNFAVHTQKLLRVLEIAKILGAENIRIFSFFIPEDKNPDDYEEEVLRRLNLFASLAAPFGITLCHENEKGIYGSTPERCQKIHQAIPAIPAIFDPANYIQCGVETAQAWAIIKPYVKYLHIKDALADGRVVEPGLGVGHVPEILHEYLEMGGTHLTVEPHLALFDSLKGLEKDGIRSAVGDKTYASKEAAFAAAVEALRALIQKEGRA